MSVVRGMELGRELARTLRMIDEQIELVKQEAQAMDISPLAMRDANNSYVMIPLLAAKAQALHAIVLVNQR
jgi:hypothetical protein